MIIQMAIKAKKDTFFFKQKENVILDFFFELTA